MPTQGAYLSDKPVVKGTGLKINVQCNNCGFMTKVSEKSFNEDAVVCYWCQSESFSKLENPIEPRFKIMDSMGFTPAYVKGIKLKGGL